MKNLYAGTVIISLVLLFKYVGIADSHYCEYHESPTESSTPDDSNDGTPLVSICAGNSHTGGIDSEVHRAPVHIIFGEDFWENPQEVTISFTSGNGYQPSESAWWWQGMSRIRALMELNGHGSFEQNTPITINPSSNLSGFIRSSNAVESYTVEVALANGQIFTETGYFEEGDLSIEFADAPPWNTRTYAVSLEYDGEPVEGHDIKVGVSFVEYSDGTTDQPQDRGSAQASAVAGEPVSMGSGNYDEGQTDEYGKYNGSYQINERDLNEPGVERVVLSAVNLSYSVSSNN